MPESTPTSPTSEIPQAILAKVIRTRRLGPFTVRQVDKTGSSLYFLDNEEQTGIVRNAEIPAGSMAVWEFLHTYAQTLFPEEISRKLYGPWQRPQVVPILDRKGAGRVYYSGETATAYSAIVGLDTQRLTELWELGDVVNPYYFQNWFPREARCLDCTSYHLAKDVLTDIPSLDPNHEVMNLLEQYWEEFTRLNQNSIGRTDLLRHKELRRQDMDRDDAYRSSLKLVETAHAVTMRLTDVYRELEKSDQPLLWKEKPVKNMLLLFIHLYQTSAQQSILWWLGIAHGHLHSFNTVSRIPSPDSPESRISPVVTNIIDFDNARTSVSKLASNDELFASIDGENLKAKIKDRSLNSNVRLQLIFYLPLELWDEDVVQTINEVDINSGIKGKLVSLIASRADRDVHRPEKYTWFSDFVYGMERQNQPEYYPAFGFTLAMLLKKPELIQSANQALTVAAEYLKDGKLVIDDSSSLNLEQRLLLLSAIYEYRRVNNGTPYSDSLNLSPEEVRFTIGQLKDQDTTHHATRLWEMAIEAYYDETVAQLFHRVKEGDQESIELASEIMTFFFTRDREDYSVNIVQGSLVRKLLKSEAAGLAIGLINFKAIPRKAAILAYKNLREELETNYELDEKPQERSQLLLDLDKLAERGLGKLFILAQQAKRMIRREKKSHLSIFDDVS